MPLEVTALPLKKQDVQVVTSKELGVTWQYTTAHAHVDQQGYGRMDPSSPGQGLSTHSVASCTVVVLHCHTTKRTILTHSPNFLYMTTFIPMVDWITGGPDEPRYPPTPNAFQVIAFNRGLDGEQPDDAPRSTTVDVAVFRGYQYGDAASAARFGHDGWMRDLRAFFAGFSRSRQITVDIFDSPQLLKYGAILVSKGTGKIALPVPHPNSPQRPKTIFFEQSPAIPTEFTTPQTFQCLFVSNLLMGRRIREAPPIGMHFDGQVHKLPLPLYDEARQLLRSVRLKQPPSSQAEIIARFQASDNWVQRQQDDYGRILKGLFRSAAILPVCEMCGEDGKSVCAACKGAWYCESMLCERQAVIITDHVDCLS